MTDIERRAAPVYHSDFSTLAVGAESLVEAAVKWATSVEGKKWCQAVFGWRASPSRFRRRRVRRMAGK